MLGPIEVVDKGRPVVLGGPKQRATLGALLLEPNKVVATSQLLNALWGGNDVPATARKILQNAVYNLRSALSGRWADGDPAAVTLLTQPPGYMLRVDPDRVDLHLFHKWVRQGRERLARGEVEPASSLLRDALALWRGPALADLVEAGIQWLELATVENTRLDVLEDYFEAQLACGNHHTVLAELERMVQTEPLRERSCGQLMLALYRCGRQADALQVYSRARAVLVESLGLEPGRALQQLQHAILVQDPALSRPAALPALTSERQGARLLDIAPRQRTVETTTVQRAETTTPQQAGATMPQQPAEPTVPQPRTGGTAAPARTAGTARRTVGVLSVRTHLAPSLADVAAEDLDVLLEGTSQLVREQVERFGGTVTATLGSVTLALFGLEDPGEIDAQQAVLAALAIRDVLDLSTGHGPGTPQLTVHCSVTMGEVSSRRKAPGAPATVVGAALDDSLSLLCEVPAGQVRVCDRVRRASEHRIRYRPFGPPAPGWQALGVQDEEPPTAGDAEEYEYDILRGLMQRTRHRGVPHLVTVLGEGGTGKSRLLRGFARRAVESVDQVRVFTGRFPAPDEDGCRLRAPAQILAGYCGIGDDDLPTAKARLAAAIRSLFPSERTSTLLLSRLGPLVDTVGIGVDDQFGEVNIAAIMDAWCQFFQQAARQEPLVLCVDDLHLGADAVLDAVEGLAETAGSGPLFVVVGARPELLLRRPDWAGGKSHATTVTLGRPERITNEQLVELLLSAARHDDTPSLTP
ncbi:BTAD domain-containing putative transcriptional regulator [Streptomyces sp. L500]